MRIRRHNNSSVPCIRWHNISSLCEVVSSCLSAHKNVTHTLHRYMRHGWCVHSACIVLPPFAPSGIRRTARAARPDQPAVSQMSLLSQMSLMPQMPLTRCRHSCCSHHACDVCGLLLYRLVQLSCVTYVTDVTHIARVMQGGLAFSDFLMLIPVLPPACSGSTGTMPHPHPPPPIGTLPYAHPPPPTMHACMHPCMHASTHLSTHPPTHPSLAPTPSWPMSSAYPHAGQFSSVELSSVELSSVQFSSVELS